MSAELKVLTSMSELVDYPADTPINLRFSSQPISVSDMRTIAGYMRGRCVRSIDLTGSHINDESTVILAQAARTSKSLRTVYLTDNNVGDVGAKAIAGCIALGSRITWRVTSNRIGAEGGEALTRAWALNRSHYSIDLSNNQLGDDGAERVALALRECTGNLYSLRLTHNGIGPDGDQALAANVPLTINVTYRTEEITASEYFYRHPWLYFITLIVFFPILLFIPCLPNCEDDTPGLLHDRTGPRA